MRNLNFLFLLFLLLNCSKLPFPSNHYPKLPHSIFYSKYNKVCTYHFHDYKYTDVNQAWFLSTNNDIEKIVSDYKSFLSKNWKLNHEIEKHKPPIILFWVNKRNPQHKLNFYINDDKTQIYRYQIELETNIPTDLLFPEIPHSIFHPQYSKVCAYHFYNFENRNFNHAWYLASDNDLEKIVSEYKSFLSKKWKLEKQSEQDKENIICIEWSNKTKSKQYLHLSVIENYITKYSKYAIKLEIITVY